jgi:hypothetical protein
MFQENLNWRAIWEIIKLDMINILDIIIIRIITIILKYILNIFIDFK